MVSGVRGPAGLAPQGSPAGQLFSSSQTTQCSYKFSELSILVFTITQVNIYRHPIKLIQGKQPFSPPVLVFNFFETVGDLEGINAHRRCPALQGGRARMADFGIIWGRNFFDQKSTFFNFNFDKKWFGGGLDPLAVEKKKVCDFFFPLGRCNGAGQK